MEEINLTDSLRKSSRSKADLFEVLIAEFLARNYGIKKDFSKLISELKNFITKFENGQSRIKEQEGKVKETSRKLINFLKKEGVNNIKDVEWIGRYHQAKHTLSDVDLTLKNNEVIGVSLKSTRLGLGTQKNLGYETLKNYLLLNIDKELEKMWKDIRLELKQKGGYLKSLSNSSKIDIRNKKRDYPIIQEIGKKHGHPVQVNSVRQSINNFNNLSEEKKSNFMRLLFGLGENKRKLLNVIAQKDKVLIYWNEVYNSIVSGESLRAEKIGDVSYEIYFKDKPIIRLQASFTNGIGISPYCQRAFLP